MTLIKQQDLVQSLLSVYGLHSDNVLTELVNDAVWEHPHAQPFESTRDLLTLYASNLRNGGSPAGPRSDLLGKMTDVVLGQSGFIKNNQLIHFDRRTFAQHAIEHLHHHPLSKNGGEANLDTLQGIALGLETGMSRRLLYKLVISIEQFAHHLIDRYDGTAHNFSRQFLNVVKGDNPASKVQSVSEFRIRLLEELNFLLMGPAIASNFMKDSQIGLARGYPNLFETYLGALAKPDMHVMRMMLAITGRIKLDHPDILKTLCFEQKFISLYAQNQPHQGWPSWDSNLSGEEKCLRDMNFLCYSNSFPTLFLDRILYLAGSGNSVCFQHLTNPPQLERYRRFLTSLGVFLKH